MRANLIRKPLKTRRQVKVSTKADPCYSPCVQLVHFKHAVKAVFIQVFGCFVCVEDLTGHQNDLLHLLHHSLNLIFCLFRKSPAKIQSNCDTWNMAQSHHPNFYRLHCSHHRNPEEGTKQLTEPVVTVANVTTNNTLYLSSHFHWRNLL